MIIFHYPCFDIAAQLEHMISKTCDLLIGFIYSILIGTDIICILSECLHENVC